MDLQATVRCYGHFGCVEERHSFDFHVHSDGTLSAFIAPVPDESNDEIFDMSTILADNEVVQRCADPDFHFTKRNNEDQIQVPCIASSEGSYEFNGSCFSIRTQPFESCAEVTLLPNGRLRALVHECRLQSDHPDTAIIKGSWKRDQICFAMTRNRDVTTCSFMGKPCDIRVRGTWQTKRWRPEELLLDSGEFDFRLLR